VFAARTTNNDCEYERKFDALRKSIVELDVAEGEPNFDLRSASLTTSVGSLRGPQRNSPANPPPVVASDGVDEI
jgi:hypothetical protein